MTVEIRETIYNKCVSKISDPVAINVMQRLSSESDLVASEAKYHVTCFTVFMQDVPKNSRPGRPVSDEKSEAFIQLCSYMEKSDDCQYTISELQEYFKTLLPQNSDSYGNKQLLNKLKAHFGDRLNIINSPGLENILCLRETTDKILKDEWKYRICDSLSDNEIIVRAGKIIKKCIQSIIYNKECYPTESDIKNGGIESIPPILLLLIETIILPHNKEPSITSKRKCLTIANSILAATRPRSFLSPSLLGLGVYLHRNFASKQMIDILNSFGFCENYAEVDRYISSSTCHSEPAVLDNTFIQFAFDNADHNTCTIDGKNTVHILGGIQAVCPASHVITPTKIPRLLNLSSELIIGKFGFIPVRSCHKAVKLGLKNVTIMDLKNKTITPSSLTSAMCMDLLYMSNQLLFMEPQPGWGGTMCTALQGSKVYDVSRVLPLPFINLDPNNPVTIATAMIYAVEKCDKVGLKSCFFTCDLPLYKLAMQIKHSAPEDSVLKRVIVRLGGFHLLMSFLGAIGYIMSGSGLKELWELVYAPASVMQMLSGHYYSRALRAHFLTQQVIFNIIIKDITEFNTIKIELKKQYLKMLSGELALHDVITPESLKLKNIFREKLENISHKNRTAKLWLQYWDMVELVRLFVRAERVGDWKLHLYCVTEMLPYFHAAGHLNYARCAHLYVQDMQQLEDMVNTNEHQMFLQNFAVRRTDKLWAGLWSDLTIEQVLMRSMKSRGGITRGRGMSETTIAKWVGSAAACSNVINAVQEFANFTRPTHSEQHKDMRDASKIRDCKDMEIMMKYMSPRSPILCNTVENLVSLSSGVCADSSINCDNAREQGLKSMEKMFGNNYCDVTLSRKLKVNTLAHVSSTSIQIGDELIPIQSQQLLNRISCATTDESEKKEAIGYELAWYPPSISKDGALRKTQKCTLNSHLVKNSRPSSIPSDTTYVIDGGLLLHRCPWIQGHTYQNLFKNILEYLLQHYGTNCNVVFDCYEKMCTKDHERRRRTTQRVSPEIQFENNMIVTHSREEFLSNDKNKQRLIINLAPYLMNNNIKIYHAEDDADYLIVMTALNIASQRRHVTVVSEDTDVLVLMCAHSAPPRSRLLCVLQPGRGNNADRVISVSSVNKFLGEAKKCILFCHAISGCDTTSALFSKGKIKFLNILIQYKKIREDVAIFMQPRASKERIAKMCESFLLRLYNAPRYIKNLNELRYFNFKKTILQKQSLNSIFKIECLPPTQEAAVKHSYRVYHQVQAWLGVELDPTEWGWIRHNNTLQPDLQVSAPAPPWVLQTVSCGCTAGCKSAKCSCRQAGLYCSTLCRACQGIECTNTTPLDVTEDDEID